MVLILDVARFKYPPHWIPLTLLWDAMNTVDSATGEHRGYMLISRQQQQPSLLYTLSCKHDSWASVAKYLMEDVPLLLKSDTVKDVEEAISVVCMSLPSNFRDFIKWVAEVRRREDDSQSLSQEEIQRLVLKEELLKQVQGTGLYKFVNKFLSSAYSCSKKAAMLGHEHSLSDVATAVCCEGAKLLTAWPESSGDFCCQKTCLKLVRGDGGKPLALISGTVNGSESKQGLQILVPVKQKSTCCCTDPDDCSELCPAANDLLTVLLLALPVQTWSGIKIDKLLQDIINLVSTDCLPALLKEEVLHLRRQLILLKRCQDNKEDGDLSAPPL
ncbi:hypothetical protein RND81_04G090900 [Saponaria officinalis]